MAAKLQALKDAASTDVNMLYPMRDALKAGCSIGEVCGALREVWGEYKETL